MPNLNNNETDFHYIRTLKENPYPNTATRVVEITIIPN